MECKKIKSIFFAILLSLASTAAFANGQLKNLTILAEPNMVTALTKIARIYSQKNSVIVSISFASSADLINDIDSGEPADIFISSHKDWISNLKQKGLVDIYNITHIANDNLVLATSSQNPKVPALLLDKKTSIEESLNILDQNRAILIVDSNNTSLGQYTHSLLDFLQLQNLKIFEKLDEDKTSTFSLITENQDNYSIVLASQVKDRKDIRILAVSQNQNIFYQALVIAGDNMEGAREFARFLRSSQAKSIFKQSGFVMD